MSFQDISKTEIVSQSDESGLASIPDNTPVYSFVLIACIVIVSIFQLTTDLDKSIFLAGFVKPAFLHKYEYWRILTGGALHIGIIHLAFNSYALYSFGRLIESLSNRAHLAFVFLLSIIGGGLVSLIFSPEGTSAGASGGIVGFLGYLAVYAYKRRQLLSPKFLQSLLMTIGYNAFIGIFVLRNIDNFAHLGGLLAGAIYGLAQIPSDLRINPSETSSNTKSAGLVALVAFIAISIFSILIILRIL